MIINFLGDSITYGYGSSKPSLSFIERLKAKFPNVEINNYGICGTRIARQNDFLKFDNPLMCEGDIALYNVDFNCRVPILKQGADAVFVFGGTNDFGHGSAPFGELTDTSLYTFCGAMRTLLTTLISQYGVNFVKVICPISRYDEDSTRGTDYIIKPEGSKTLKEYNDAIKTICKDLGVEYFDFNAYLPRPLTQNNEGLFFDGVHPNDKGYELLANLIAPIIEKLVK